MRLGMCTIVVPLFSTPSFDPEMPPPPPSNDRVDPWHEQEALQHMSARVEYFRTRSQQRKQVEVDVDVDMCVSMPLEGRGYRLRLRMAW